MKDTKMLLDRNLSASRKTFSEQSEVFPADYCRGKQDKPSQGTAPQTTIQTQI